MWHGRSRFQTHQDTVLWAASFPSPWKWLQTRLTLVAFAGLLLAAGCGTSTNVLQTPKGGLLDLSSHRQKETLRKQVEKDPFPAAGEVLGKKVNLQVQ